MEIPILFQDDCIIVINKPNNTLVHPSYYARNIKDKSLVELLTEQLLMPVFPVHRLDYKTSGVLVFSKTATHAAAMQKQFEDNEIEKTYLALVRGHTPASGFVDTPVKNADTGKYREAYTAYRTLAQVVVDIPVLPYPQSRYSFIAFWPKTGRMHQLRKHANKISHPIIGDPKYGNRHHNHMFADELHFPHLFLHAAKIIFVHPENGKKMIITSPFPPFWKAAFTRLGFETEIGIKYFSNNSQNHLAEPDFEL